MRPMKALLLLLLLLLALLYLKLNLSDGRARRTVNVLTAWER